MTVDNRFLIKKFEHFEHIFVLFSQTTRLPFIECDEETFDDQVYVFTDEERIKEAGQKYLKEKIALMAVKIPQAHIKAFLSGLYSVGVNALMVQDEGAPVRVELEQLVPKPDLEEANKGPVPKLNPELQLTRPVFSPGAAAAGGTQRGGKEKTPFPGRGDGCQYDEIPPLSWLWTSQR